MQFNYLDNSNLYSNAILKSKLRKLQYLFRFVHVRNVILDGEDQDGLIESGHLEVIII